MRRPSNARSYTETGRINCGDRLVLVQRKPQREHAAVRGSRKLPSGAWTPFPRLKCPAALQPADVQRRHRRVNVLIKLCDLGVGGTGRASVWNYVPMEGTQTWQEAIGRVQGLLGTKYSEVPAALLARASGQLQLHQMLALSVRDPSGKLGVFFDTAKFYHYIEPKGELITATNVGTTLLRSVLQARVNEAERA